MPEQRRDLTLSEFLTEPRSVVIDVSLRTPEAIRTFQRKLYVKAKEEPEFRFYSLYDKVHRMDFLRHAYERVRANDGDPGVDGVTFEDIEQQGIKDWIEGLQDELRDRTYEPSAVRRVMIPKDGGGERPLGIPTIRDRVVQMAAKMVLEPIFEADFEDCAHGYRPEHSAQDAVEEVHEALCDGQTDVVDADVSSYFDEIPHDALMKSLARRVSDGAMLELVKKWLKVPVAEEDDDGNQRMTGGKKTTKGTPQGGVISPLLANIYMHRFLKHWFQCEMDEKLDATVVNYADDFVILTGGHAEEALAWTNRVMEAIGLSLNEEKTCVREAEEESFDFLGYTFGPEHYRKDGHWYLAAQPSRKAVQRLKGEVRSWMKGNPRPWPEIVETLNRKLRGWAEYFRYGTRLMAYRAIDNYVYETVVRILSKRHKFPNRSWERIPPEMVFGRLGVQRLRSKHVS
jgi:RNA-directed DNA polymerase